jgi:Zn-dependent protease with chaperone function
MDREVFARVSRQDLIRQYVTGSIIRFMLWGVFFTATALMPAQWNLQSFIITIAVLCLLLWWSHDGWLRVGQWLQLIAPPPERLLRITRDTAAKMNIPFRNVWLMRSPFALAYALPSSRSLLLTERLLEILDDNEISGVCAHELAHLSEKKSEHLMRHLIWLYFLPWMFLTPALHCLNIAGFFLLLACSLLIPKIALKISNRLEVRADAIAHANESDPGTYARALAKLYEDNLTPAVNSKKQTTHPHLYDRLLAAGVTPDFPRPVPAEDLSPHGTFFSSALGFLAVIAVFKLLNII